MFFKRNILILLALGISGGLFSQQPGGVFKPKSEKESQRNFFLRTWKPKYFRPPEQYMPGKFLEGIADGTVTVRLKDSIHPILPTQLGVNTTFRSGASMATDRVPLYLESGWGVYRFPAGSGSNIYFWDGNAPDSAKVDFTPIIGTKAKYLTPAGFATFKKAVNGEATVVVNYFYARYGITPEGTRKARVLQAARYAAGFVRRMNVELGAHVKYWEIGNECYGSWETGHVVDGVPVTGKEYGEDLRVFAREMKKADPNIKIGAVVYSKDGDWNRQVLAEAKDAADFLVVHNYFNSFKHTTYQDIMSGLPQIGEIKAMLDTLTQTVVGKPAGYFPVAMTEYNNRGNLTTTMANAIFVSEVLGELMKNGYGMATLWVGEWKWAPGTHGVIAVSDPDQPDYSPRQAYMDFRYYHAYFGDYLIGASSGNDSVKVYASRFSDSSIGLSLINEASTDRKIRINVTGLSDTARFGNAYWYEVYAENIREANKKFYINGQTGTTPGGGPEDFAGIRPYGSPFENHAIVKLRPYSVNFMVIRVKRKATGVASNPHYGLKVYPNPAENSFRISGIRKVLSLRIFNTKGETVYSLMHPSGCINIEDLHRGVYLLQVNTPSGAFYTKIIKL